MPLPDTGKFIIYLEIPIRYDQYNHCMEVPGPDAAELSIMTYTNQSACLCTGSSAHLLQIFSADSENDFKMLSNIFYNECPFLNFKTQITNMLI